jgi:hypothetical protein
MVSKRRSRDPWIRGLPQTGDPETYTEDRRCGAWGLALPQMHGTWSTAYAYAVPMRAGTHMQRTSSAARGDVECRDPGIQRSWDPDEWDHDPGDIQRMRSLVVRSYGDV